MNRHPGIRHGNHDVRINPRFLRQLPAECLPDGIDGFASKNAAIRTGKVDIFKHTHGRLGLSEWLITGDALMIQYHQLSRFDLPYIFGIQQIEAQQRKIEELEAKIK